MVDVRDIYLTMLEIARAASHHLVTSEIGCLQLVHSVSEVVTIDNIDHAVATSVEIGSFGKRGTVRHELRAGFQDGAWAALETPIRNVCF